MKLEPQRFTATLRTSGRGGGGHLVDVPTAVVSALGGRGRAAVRADFNGVPYRGSIVRMGPGFVLGVTKAIMAEIGVEVGDEIDVRVTLDDQPREIEVPDDVRAALSANPRLAEAWERLAYSHQREHVRAVEEAKRPETRARRIQRLVEALTRTT